MSEAYRHSAGDASVFAKELNHRDHAQGFSGCSGQPRGKPAGKEATRAASPYLTCAFASTQKARMGRPQAVVACLMRSVRAVAGNGRSLYPGRRGTVTNHPYPVLTPWRWLHATVRVPLHPDSGFRREHPGGDRMTGREIVPFDFHGSPFRAIDIDGEPWFVAMDAAQILGYSDAHAMGRTLDQDEKGRHTMPTPGGDQQVLVISEPGLFSAILRSRVEGAKEFKRWVTHEVLPAIRKTGSYSMAPVPQAMPIDYETAVEALLLQIRQRKAVEAQRDQIAAELEIAAPQADAWLKLVNSAGPHTMADAAKALANDPQIFPMRIGQNDLFGIISQWGWTFKVGKRWRAYQSAVETGWVAQEIKPGKHPQVKMTTKGLWEARRRLLGGRWALPSGWEQPSLYAS